MSLIGLLLIICGTISSQNIKNETIAYSYVKLPLQPLQLNEKNFVASIFVTCEEDNAIKKAALMMILRSHPVIPCFPDFLCRMHPIR